MLINDFQKMLGIRLKQLSCFNKKYKRTPNIPKKELKKAMKRGGQQTDLELLEQIIK